MTSTDNILLASNETVTANGEKAYSTTDSALLDLFAQLNRELTPEQLQPLLEKAWLIDSTKVIKIMALARDCRHGLGERRLYYYMATWLYYVHPQAYENNLDLFLEVGSYRDLVMMAHVRILLQKSALPEILRLATELSKPEPGLVAKWAPSEKSHFHDVYLLLRKQLGLTSKQYRLLLSEERERLKIVERDLCTHNFDQINFQAIPSQASLRYRKTFSRDTNASGVSNDDRKTMVSRYLEYLKSVKKGEAKIHTATLMPHQIIHQVSHSYDETLDALWKGIVDTQRSRSTGLLKKSIAVVDVSGSMASEVAPGLQAMDVSIALGLLIAQASEFANNRMITFSAQPGWFTIPEGDLKEVVSAVREMRWGMNTNLSAVFQMLLDDPEEVESIIILSDMQFDQAVTGKTSYETMRSLYEFKGRHLPKVIFWNLTAKYDLKSPIKYDQDGTALLSGFSNHLLNALVDDGDLNPMSILNRLIRRYEVKGVSGGNLEVKIEWEKVKKAVTMPPSKNKPSRSTETSIDDDEE
jgi:hypothetical protein